MKILLLLILSLFNSYIIFAQDNFEGKIIYTGDTNGVAIKDASIEVFLKQDKMLFIEINKEKKYPTTLLYDFKKEISYAFNQEDSVALSDSLPKGMIIEKKEAGVDNNSMTILGYKTEKVSFNLNTIIKEMEAWFSKDIVYKVPDSLQTIFPPLLVFINNRISLKLTLFMDQPGDEKTPGKFSITASEIIKQALPDSIFDIPAYLKIVPKKEYQDNLLREFKEIDKSLTPPPPVSPKADKKKGN